VVEIVQRGYRNPVTGFPDYRFRGNEFTGQAPWVNEGHDSDGDGVPNYLDSEPLNPKVQYRPVSQGPGGYGLQGVPQEVPVPQEATVPVSKVRKPVSKVRKPVSKVVKKSKRKTGKKK